LLLTAAGASRVIFICLGRFGREYHKFNYSLNGEVFSTFTFKKLSETAMTGSFKGGANFEFIKSLRSLMQ